MKTPVLMLGLLAATLSFGAQAGEKVYKWKDANGTVHFTDQPPPKGTQFDNVQVKGAATFTAADSASADAAPKDAAGGENAKPATGADSAQCQTARSRLTLLESKAELNTVQDGKSVPMPKEMRAAELNVARTQVQNYCGGGTPPPGN